MLGQAREQFDRFAVAMIAELLKNGLLADAIDLAVDYHNKAARQEAGAGSGARGRQGQAHENYETYATIQCIVAGQRLALGIAPYVAGDDHASSVKALLETVAGRGLKAGIVLLDRGFYSADIFSYLRSSGHDWLMPPTARTSRTRSWNTRPARGGASPRAS